MKSYDTNIHMHVTIITNKQCSYNVTLRRVRLSNVTVKKQYV